ncbi:hypothetical protein ACFFJ4_07065 [Xanthomonas dyei]|uniref:Short-chain dehydrogenase n=1 Tax=Xanthomonas dyei TaxID=743699 RepID=A0ABZ0D8Z0_9XANT|nr:hypothetical protein [Xanthomonas dyei]MCC4631970.1 hypothetical protein [Xanthomonas dyei pv. eucalypti]WOB26758.1 hypothetical protein NYR99_01730 [Xanthomonas dyei]WOB54378.1 hypothetical protein NYR95_01730 [Xanthomonas dyei]
MTTRPTVLITGASSGIGAIPPLHAAERWDALDGARQGLLSNLRQAHAAERYHTST